MSNAPSESASGAGERGSVLDPIERVSEVCFGLFMARSFVGIVRAAGAGPDAGQAVFEADFGCNLAWRFLDGVMYLLHTITDRAQRLSLAMAIQQAPDPGHGIRTLREVLSRRMSALLTDGDL